VAGIIPDNLSYHTIGNNANNPHDISKDSCQPIKLARLLAFR